jgi:hypothetical protein
VAANRETENVSRVVCAVSGPHIATEGLFQQVLRVAANRETENVSHVHVSKSRFIARNEHLHGKESFMRS